jgi:hypothetical protein
VTVRTVLARSETATPARVASGGTLASMGNKHCCDEMTAQVTHACGDCSPEVCVDQLVVFVEKFGEYGLPVRDGGSSYVLIGYCPFCGSRLPESTRDAYFEALEAAVAAGNPGPFIGQVAGSEEHAC